MVLHDFKQAFLFTFRPNGDVHGEPLVEVLVEQLADYDPSPARDAYKRSWFGQEKALPATLERIGFSELDITGIMGALHSHRDTDRRASVTPNELHAAGFQEAA